MSVMLREPEEGIGSTGAGVMDACEPVSVGTGN